MCNEKEKKYVFVFFVSQTTRKLATIVFEINECS